MFNVDQALNLVLYENDDEPSWSFEIPCEFMQRTIHLMEFCIAQKLGPGKPALKQPPALITNTYSIQPLQIDQHRIKRLLELPSPISMTHITQRHIQRRVDNKYRKEDAEALMEDVSQLSVGEIVTAEYSHS